jgi:hypothetical protein
MKFFLYLVVICAIYYYYYLHYYPSDEQNKYFCGFVACYVAALYIYNFHPHFAYKLTRNVYNSDKYPIHDLLPEYKKKNQIKEDIILKQNGRCHKCHMKLHPRFEDEYKMMYIQPLDQGGPNQPYNLKVVCPTCYQRMRFYT